MCRTNREKPQWGKRQDTMSRDLDNTVGRASCKSAQAKVSLGPNVRRNGMFQTQLKAAKQITNKLGNSTREGALPSHEASQNMPLSFAYGDVDTEADRSIPIRTRPRPILILVIHHNLPSVILYLYVQTNRTTSR